jgi:DNA replication and repair protein RecF
MYIKKITLENFRNFEAISLELDPKPGIQIFLGQNAQGKTNLLESIFLLSFPRSFRAISPNELIRFDQNYFTITADFEAQNSKDLKLKFGYQKKPIRRTYQKNEAEVPLADYLTNLQTVLFTPEDVEILNNSPAERRRLLDTILSQVDREYFADLIHFTKILKQRNALLKRVKEKKANYDELLYWNNEFASTAEKIQLKRNQLIDYFAAKLPSFYQEISEQEGNHIEIHYKFSGSSKLSPDKSYKELLLELFEHEKNYELAVGHSVVGPHRDDFNIEINHKSVAQYCSRGEKRSFMLVLKMIELEYLAEKSGSKPILLLDDVFSELDQTRRKKLLKLAEQYQTLISTVEKSYFEDYPGEIALYTLAKQSVIRYN